MMIAFLYCSLQLTKCASTYTLLSVAAKVIINILGGTVVIHTKTYFFCKKLAPAITFLLFLAYYERSQLIRYPHYFCCTFLSEWRNLFEQIITGYPSINPFIPCINNNGVLSALAIF